MRCLYVFYDNRCGLCSVARRWALRQRQFVELVFTPSDSALATQRLAGIGETGALPDELVVVSEEGGVYRGGDAWIMCLYALEDYREWALRLATPALRPLARNAFALLSKNRARISRWMNLVSERELADALATVPAPACEIDGNGHDQLLGVVRSMREGERENDLGASEH